MCVWCVGEIGKVVWWAERRRAYGVSAYSSVICVLVAACSRVGVVGTFNMASAGVLCAYVVSLQRDMLRESERGVRGERRPRFRVTDQGKITSVQGSAPARESTCVGKAPLSHSRAPVHQHRIKSRACSPTTTHPVAVYASSDASVKTLCSRSCHTRRRPTSEISMNTRR